jgi:hypothetical protein
LPKPVTHDTQDASQLNASRGCKHAMPPRAIGFTLPGEESPGNTTLPAVPLSPVPSPSILKPSAPDFDASQPHPQALSDDLNFEMHPFLLRFRVPEVETMYWTYHYVDSGCYGGKAYCLMMAVMGVTAIIIFPNNMVPIHPSEQFSCCASSLLPVRSGRCSCLRSIVFASCAFLPVWRCTGRRF